MTPGTPCLFAPSGLQVQGDYLFIADRHNSAIRVFNLRTHELRTLAGHPDLNATRMGPLRLFAPDLPPESCASLPDPVALGLGADGTLLVNLPHGLAQLDGHRLLAPLPEQSP